MSEEISDESIKMALNSWVQVQKRDQNLRAAKLAVISIGIILSIVFAFTRQYPDLLDRKEDYVSLVNLQGIISPGTIADSHKISASLLAAFKDEKSKGVALLINSPGGTPTQSMIIYREILRLKEKFNKQIIAIGEDSMTSGAYLVAMGADKIYALPSSTVGSIGVIFETVAYDKLANKYGVESRVYTAGKSKKRFDPFSPEKPEDREKARQLLKEIHNQFIVIVEKGRGDKLAQDKALLFSGDFWTGEQALGLGLIDSIGTLHEAIIEEFGVEEFIQYKAPTTFDDVMKSLPF